MTSQSDPIDLLRGLRAAVTVADADYRIVFMNDLANAHYGSRGGAALVGTHLLDCHNTESQVQLREMYARYQAGDLIPTRYHENQQDGTGKSILFIPLVVEGQFKGVAELQWYERSELVIEE